MLLFYVLVALPYRLAFLPDVLTGAIMRVELAVDVAFMVGILVNFRTGYIDSEVRASHTPLPLRGAAQRASRTSTKVTHKPRANERTDHTQRTTTSDERDSCDTF